MTKDEVVCPCDTCKLPEGDFCELDTMVWIDHTSGKATTEGGCPHPAEVIAYIDHAMGAIIGGDTP